jgi:DNA-binding response OmpR family regulator
MPVLDGYGVLHAVHRNEVLKHTPFIFLTAKAERSECRKGIELGADDYVTKPFTGTELLAAVDGSIRKHERLLQQLMPDTGGTEDLPSAPRGLMPSNISFSFFS